MSIVSESSIHSFGFIFGENRSKFEKIIWIICLLLSLCGCIYYVHISFKRWQFNPDIVTRTQERELREFPMPAVTICPTVFGREELINLTQIVEKLEKNITFSLNETECKTMIASLHWCNYELPKKILEGKSDSPKEKTSRGGNRDDKKKNEDPNQKPDALPPILQKTCSKYVDQKFDIVKEIWHNGIKLNNAMRDQRNIKRFDQTFTHEGSCFTYNMLSNRTLFREVISKDFDYYPKEHNDTAWDVDTGYPNREVGHPQRADSSGREFNIVIPSGTQQNACYGDHFKVFFHAPNEMISVQHRSFKVMYDRHQEYEVNIKNHLTNANMGFIKPNVRKCYFKGEKALKLFKGYSRAHCELECLASFVLKKCKCVPFYMPRDKNTKICGLIFEDRNCTKNATGRFRDKDKEACGCYSFCHELKYMVEETVVHGNRNRSTDGKTTIKIIFPDREIEEVETIATYTVSNFVAEIGGYFGLFMGCSILSFVELFYFAIIVLLTRFKKNSEVVDISKETQTLESKVKTLESNVEGMKECLMKIQASLSDLQRRMKIAEDGTKNQQQVENQNLIR